MAATTGSPTMVTRPVGRTIAISVLDRYGQPAAGATVQLAVNGRAAGMMLTGSDKKPLSIEVFSPTAQIDLEVSLLGQTQAATVPMGQDKVTFSFTSTMRFAIGVTAVVECPDGRRGNPCVMCFDGADSWRLCA
jgi:hypothetical protein